MEPVRADLEEGRSVTAPGAIDRGRHRLVARQHVVAVDRGAGEPVRLGPLGDPLHRHLLRQRHGDRVQVVLAHPHHRQLVDAGEVQPLVPVALAGGAVAEPAPHDGVFLPIPHGVCHAGRLRTSHNQASSRLLVVVSSCDVKRKTSQTTADRAAVRLVGGRVSGGAARESSLRQSIAVHAIRGITRFPGLR